MDQCIQDNEGSWNLKDVFIEAARITNFSSAKRGKHYNNGFGFVTITDNQQDKSTSAHKTTLTRENHDRLIKKLKNTVRGYPFCDKHAYGADRQLRYYCETRKRHFMTRFEREQEYNYRVKNVTRGKTDSIWYLKEVFWEAAIDNPEYFEGFTHYNNPIGFIKASEQHLFDLFIGYVRMINRLLTRNEERSWNNPHPKWFEFRKRVDGAKLDHENRWELGSVFREAAKKLLLCEE